MVLTASAASASRPFGITPQGARGESRKRLSPFLVQIWRSRSVLYSPSAQWAFSVIGGITRPVTRSRLLGLLVNLAPRPTLPPW